jgi:membrane protein YdbS with pleckstrin-like domain
MEGAGRSTATAQALVLEAAVMRAVWGWLQTPNLVWWIYGGGLALLIVLGIVKARIVKKKRRRTAMARASGADSLMPNRPS